MIYQSLRVPRWLQKGIKPNHRGSRIDKLIVGGDTETVNGKPLSFQFYSEDFPLDTIIFVNEKNAREKFLKFCDGLRQRVHYVFYFHNLGFDLVELLWGQHERLKENGSEFAFSAGGYDIRGFYGAPTFCALRKRGNVCIDLINSFSFYRGSLAKASALYCPELPKLRSPVGLGSIRFTGKCTAFVEYAMRDAQVTFHIGKAVEALHHEFDITQCVSIAHMAARIFRHRYLTYTIPHPPQDMLYASLDSYHGGKNNTTASPGLIRNVYSIDISSAYPDAMRGLPAYSRGDLYKRYRGYRGKPQRTLRAVPPHGVYCVSGELAPCKWPVLFTHAFKPVRGRIQHTWVQGLELNEALSSGEFTPSHVRGYWYDSDKDHQAPALRAFCDDFYARKQAAPDKVQRYGYKNILNSQSGKFIQTRKRTLKTFVDCDNMEVSNAAEMLAGGLFHPWIASEITAHTRARIHQLEHYYEALHTATDGIFTLKRPAADVTFDGATHLGELACDAQGDLILLRNKLYILYDDEPIADSEIGSSIYPGRRVAKAALHGFQGDIPTLERLIASGSREYVVNRPNKLGESIRRNLVPNEFRERKMTLNVGVIHV